MPPQDRRPILHKGEVYSKLITKASGGGSKTLPHTLEEAFVNIQAGLKSTIENFETLPAESRLPNELVFCVRMDSDFSAKSYYPDSFFTAFSKFGELNEVGSRRWHKTESEIEEDGKLLFIRSNPETLSGFLSGLKSGNIPMNQGFENEIRTLESIDLLHTDEKIMGLYDGWDEGLVEIVLHPFETDHAILTEHLVAKLTSAGVSSTRLRIKSYDEGVTFASFKANRKNLELLSDYNPLRSAHPLEFNGLRPFRASTGPSMPNPPEATEKSTITIGVFDGGVDDSNPYLSNFVENIDVTKEAPDETETEHGTGVVGAALYGALNNYPASQTLPTPAVNVRSFRIFPLEDSDTENEIELYEVIEKIEKVVPEQSDISVYNLSFGPDSQILDDPISRFTWSLDRLAHKYGVLFCVAVGNSGTEVRNRIQPPSDLVNGFGVGAHSKVDGVITSADYSSIGPGREGNKIKPDFCVFGGCAQNPFQFVPYNGNLRMLSSGTSLASPIVAGLAGEMLGRTSDSIDHLAVRALLIQSALNDEEQDLLKFGHGVLPESIEEILNCEQDSYTLLYRGSIQPAKYIELPIPWDERIKSGSVEISWVLVTESEVDHQSPDDYTSSSVELVLYPNANKFTFKNQSGDEAQQKTKTIDVRDVEALATVGGWKKPNFPNTLSGSSRKVTEDEARKEAYKWDTVDKRSATCPASNFAEPFLHLHAFSRGIRTAAQKIDYSLVLKIKSIGGEVDPYAVAIENFTELAPIRLLNRNEVRVQING